MKKSKVKLIKKDRESAIFEITAKLEDIIAQDIGELIERDTIYDLFTLAEKTFNVDRTELQDEWLGVDKPEKTVKIQVEISVRKGDYNEENTNL